ncbi:MAG: creatininase family protein [Rhizobiaceae bacterium]|nr:creatininase family protein [Rhizobiaceae bacterium]
MFLENVQINTIHQYLSLVVPESRVYWLYLISALILAFIAYHQINHDHDEDGNDIPSSRPGFLAWVFNKEVWLHPSSLQDYKFFLINAIVYYGFVVQFMLGMHGVAVFMNGTLTSMFGELSAPLITSEVSLIIYTILSVIAIDLGVYLSHRMMHNVPVLWEFHKVHHSAVQLNPMTLFRMHPVDLFITATTVAILGGIAYAGLFYFTGEKPQALTLFGLNIITFVFYIVGYNLRHSHIWLNYPVWLSKIFISPAQHQIHHSSDPKHFDQNFGLIFSFWDIIGKSHYIPRGHEKLKYGLSREEPNPFNSVSDIYFKPFQWSWNIISDTLGSGPRKIMAALSIFILASGYLTLSNLSKQQIALSTVPSVHLAKLTWTEINQAMQKGYDTVLIPTGGIEQNGPHVVLGKHNLVISRAAHDLAHKMGNTLVAPVIDHVPEGAIDPKDGHMIFTGTISVPEDVFQSVLEATARSMRAHGFRKIFFIGDSGGNQEGQEQVADRLSKEWARDDMIVAHIGDYYSANGQFAHLQNAGYADKEIGWHAGMRDTSELLYVAPEAVRKKWVKWPEGMQSGASGSLSKSSAKIGRQMIALKVDAAYRQISEIVKNHDPASSADRIALQVE